MYFTGKRNLNKKKKKKPNKHKKGAFLLMNTDEKHLKHIYIHTHPHMSIYRYANEVCAHTPPKSCNV